MKSRKAKSPAATTLIDQLVEVSRFYGADPSYVLAGGGNTSAKTADTLYVKASGYALATIGPEGFVALDRAKLDALLASDLGAQAGPREEKFKAGILAARLQPEKNQRPSVESLLHNLIPDTLVVHTHSTLVNALTCCVKGGQLVEELFGGECLWIPLIEPGYNLARAVSAGLKDYAARSGGKTPTAILMQNHGMFVGGATGEEIRAKTDAVIRKVAAKLGAARAHPFGAMKSPPAATARKWVARLGPVLRGVLADDGAERLKIVPFDDSEFAAALACGADGQSATDTGPLTPDQIVYCGSWPLWLESPADDETDAQLVARVRQAVAEFRKKRGADPLVVLVRGLGMFTAGDDVQAARTTREVYLDAVRVMATARKLGGIHALEDRFREFIEAWEVESYRKAVAKAAAAGGRAAGKVAFVTGAAQGFGLEIAQDLAAQGACVALADLNARGVQAAADDLCKARGAGRAVGLTVDVTDGNSLADALHRVVRTYGGLDVLVSNAGVLKAESVKTQPAKDFDFVTAVNYKGYFLCVQNVAPILALQHLACPSYLGDIVQINSKSGLAGSNRNAAYAGSKFGGVGLTQSFALELIDDGIKVNAVCPGNFYDGPLWSDPDHGLFVQYLRAGKVPGAKTIADVRKAYEAKSPIHRGCTTKDVMAAVYYVLEQKYETGQAVPVTGGQVMLS